MITEITMANATTVTMALDKANDPTKVARAETCDECGSWVKQMLQTKNPALDPVADDVGTLGLDALMRGGTWRRGGVNPFLIGY